VLLSTWSSWGQGNVSMVGLVGERAGNRLVRNHPTFPLPTSSLVQARVPKVAADGTLWYHTSSTPVELLGDLPRDL
jgi:hypothetical protein